MFVRSRFVVPLLGEAGTHLPARCLVNLTERLRGQDLWRLGRTIERSRPLEAWPRDREAETCWRLGRETETVGDSTETAEVHGYVADGRPSP